MRGRIKFVGLFLILIVGITSFKSYLNNSIGNKTFKCLIQLKNYEQDGAYLVATLVKPNGDYEKSLSVNGDDLEWLEDLTSWWGFYEDKQENINAITGESILSGERKQFRFKLDSTLLDRGYKIRFESIVEDHKYYKKDVEVDFSKENLGKKIKGNGYIRFIKII